MKEVSIAFFSVIFNLLAKEMDNTHDEKLPVNRLIHFVCLDTSQTFLNFLYGRYGYKIDEQSKKLLNHCRSVM